MSNFFEFKAEDTRCEVHSMEEYRGKVVLVVNTATQCGFTPQYDDLQDLYEKYQEEGLEILDFPCNQFGNQAPGTNEEIVSFCDANFGVTFPHYAKMEKRHIRITRALRILSGILQNSSLTGTEM